MALQSCVYSYVLMLSCCDCRPPQAGSVMTHRKSPNINAFCEKVSFSWLLVLIVLTVLLLPLTTEHPLGDLGSFGGRTKIFQR